MYSLPVAAFVPGGLIKSSDDNTINSDIATALTQSLATTGVSTMTGSLIGSAGLVTSPGYTFSGSTKTGFYLSGTNQIGWAANGVQGATFNSDTSVTFNGTISAAKGTIPIGAVMDFAGSVAPAGWLLCNGSQASTTTYAALFAVIGTTYGSGAGTFGLPDCQGRVVAGVDGGAGRLTSTGLGTAAILGASGGNQTHTLVAGEIPNLPSTGSNVISVGGGGASNDAPINTSSASAVSYSGTGTPLQVWTGGALGGLTGSNTINVNTSTTGGGAHTIVQPTIVMNKIIFAGI